MAKKGKYAKDVEIDGVVFTVDKLSAGDFAVIQDKYISLGGERTPHMEKIGSYQKDMVQRATVKIKDGDKIITDKAEICSYIDGMYADEYQELFLSINSETIPSDGEVKNS